MIADQPAEEVVAACAAATRRGARLVAERLDVVDFYTPALRRVVTATLHPDVDQAEDDAPAGDRQDSRLRAVAALADVELSWMAQLVDARPTMWDIRGTHAARVRDAAERRRALAAAEELRAAALAGEPLPAWVVDAVAVLA